MKRFIIATLIYMLFIVLGVLVDYILYYYDIAESLPLIWYYTTGWLSAGVYVTIAYRKRKVKK